jgi:hypothetical protein
MILRSTDVRGALKSRQRGFMLDPYRFSAAPPTGLLDAWTTNLIFAGGMNLLVGSYYGGNALRIRRSGDNAEDNFGFTPLGVWNAVAAAAFCVAGGGTQHGYVTTVYNQLGGSVHATQATPGSQMQIVASGSALSEIRGDGTDDLLTITSLGFSSSNAFTHYLRGWMNMPAAGGRFIDTPGEYNIAARDGTTGNIFLRSGGSFFRLVGGGHSSSTECRAFRFDGSAGSGDLGNRHWVGATEQTTGSPAGSSWSTQSAITSQTIYLGNRADLARSGSLYWRNYAVRRIADAPADIVTINGLLA